MRRLRQLARRAAAGSVLGVEVPLLALWAALASLLSVVSARVTDWNAMTDELVYERLAISVGQSHSVLPRLHGELVRSLAQLYPVLISPWFWRGSVPTDLRNAHVFNAWLMSSACIPVFVLARRVTGRRWPAYVLALVTICVPWIIYATTLLTEVAGYPAFMLALLGMYGAAAAPSLRRDLLALLGLALAFVARTQFVLLVAVLPLALVLYHGGDVLRAREGRGRLLRESLRAHALIVVVYVLLGGAALVVRLAGEKVLRLSVYGNEISGNLVPPGFRDSITGHAADLAFGLGILPFVVGVAWLAANVVRVPTTREQHAFACVGTATVAVLLVVISAWDLRLGQFVLDRYLYYLGPVVLLAFVCALLDSRRPRWSLLAPAALVAVGFATHLQAEFLWSGQFPLSTDSPIATLYKPIASLGGGSSGAAAILTVATLAISGAFVLADRLVSHAYLTLALTAAMIVAFPLDTVHAFRKLFAANGPSGRPLTGSATASLDWVDQMVGTGGRVTEVPYPISASFFVSRQGWRDLEFWNKSVRYAVHYPAPDTYGDALIWFPNNSLGFDLATGAATRSLTPYVVQAVTETRFRISGTVVLQRPDVMLIRTEQPWRTDWLTSGLYDDGWMEPHKPALIRVFAKPDQTGPVVRTLTLRLAPSPGLPRQSFTLSSNRANLHGEATRARSALESIEVCVPPGRFAEVRLTTPQESIIPADANPFTVSPGPRRGGLFVNDLSLADEVGGPCAP